MLKQVQHDEASRVSPLSIEMVKRESRSCPAFVQIYVTPDLIRGLGAAHTAFGDSGCRIKSGMTN